MKTAFKLLALSAVVGRDDGPRPDGAQFIVLGAKDEGGRIEFVDVAETHEQALLAASAKILHGSLSCAIICEHRTVLYREVKLSVCPACFSVTRCASTVCEHPLAPPMAWRVANPGLLPSLCECDLPVYDINTRACRACGKDWSREASERVRQAELRGDPASPPAGDERSPK